MAKSGVTSVSEYIASKPAAVRTTLRRVRSALRKALPAADETISYAIPTYKLGGKAVIYFAAWTNHYSVYPATATLVAEFADELAPYEVSKGTIRFPYAANVPSGLIARLAVFRAKEAVRSSRTSRRRAG